MAQVSQINGMITNVSFYNGTNPIASFTNAPYSLVWTNPTEGTNDVSAVAINQWGLSATSTVARVFASRPPTVLMQRPVNPTGIRMPGGILTFAATATSVFEVTHFMVYLNGQPWFAQAVVSPSTQSSLAVNLPVPAGLSRFTVSVGAVNTAGLIGKSAPALIMPRVMVPPTVHLTTPVNHARFGSSQPIQIIAAASDVDGAIAQVVFKAVNRTTGATITIGTVSSGPGGNYVINWTPPAAGNYFVYAVATDTEGLTTQSGSVNISANDAPLITITAPATGATFTRGANVSFSVNVSDGDGSVSTVEYYEGTTRLAIRNGTPFGFTWSQVPLGVHQVTAVATDNFGARTTSLPVTFTIIQDTDGDGLPDDSDPFPDDYYNGQLPVLTVLSGNGQSGWPNMAAAQPIVIKVCNAAGQPLINAPVSLEADSQMGAVKVTATGAWSRRLAATTDEQGKVSFYYLLPNSAPTACHAHARARSGVNMTEVEFQAYTTIPGGSLGTVGAGPRAIAGVYPDGTVWIYMAGQFRRVTLPNKILKIAPGLMAIGAVDELGKVYEISYGGGYVERVVPLAATDITAEPSNINFVTLLSDGSVWTWGNYSYGNYGGAFKVNLPMAARSIKASPIEYTAVLEDGSIWAWGWHIQGTAFYFPPTPLPATWQPWNVWMLPNYPGVYLSPGLEMNLNKVLTINGATRIDSGWYHWAILASDGRVWTFGWNFAGQLGDGTTQDRWTPQLVPGLENIVEIACGEFSTTALRADGAVFTWGTNPGAEPGMQLHPLSTPRVATTPTLVNLPARTKHIASGGRWSSPSWKTRPCMVLGITGMVFFVSMFTFQQVILCRYTFLGQFFPPRRRISWSSPPALNAYLLQPTNYANASEQHCGSGSLRPRYRGQVQAVWRERLAARRTAPEHAN